MKKETSKHMPNAPLAYVIAQLRISPILKMPEYISEIQKLLMHKYPDYKENRIQSIEIKPSGLSVKESTRWEFTNIESTCGLLLSGNSLTFHTTSYDKHESFFEEIKDVLMVVEEKIPDVLVVSQGLRYLNIIVPENGGELSKYLGFDLIENVFSGLNPKSLHDTRQAILDFDDGALIFKYNIVPKNIDFMWPQELLPMSLRFPEIYHKAVNNKSIVRAILDFDRVMNSRTKINHETLISNFNKIWNDVHMAFEKVRTDYANGVWSNSR